MDDLISRQAAITLPIMPKEYRKHEIDCDDAYEQGWGDCQSCIGRLPTAEPKWIPMAKRSPEESGRYLVTIYDGATTMATVAPWHPRAKAWEMTGRRAHYHVTAWMPLPKPYKGGEV